MTLQNGTITGKDKILALWQTQDEKLTITSTKLEPIEVLLDDTRVTRVVHVTVLGMGAGSARQHYQVSCALTLYI